MLEKTINNAICALLFRCEQQSVKEMDKIHAMQLFIKVAELESFSRAADFFALPKGSVSRQIQALEHQLGTQLLQRTTRRVKLTPEGMTYYQRAKDVLSNLSELDGLFQQDATSISGKLRIDIPPGIAKSLLLPRLSEFLYLHPGIELELSSHDRPVDILHDGFDCVIRTGALPEDGVIARPLGKLTMVNCASPHYLTRFGYPQSPDDLNAFLFKLESAIANISALKGEKETEALFRQKASARRDAVNRYLWDDENGIYRDYDWRREQLALFSAAAIVPLYVGMANHEQADRLANAVRSRLLTPGGILASEYETGEQWDKPNGWAPLQWMAIQGFKMYGDDLLGDEIARSWLKTVNQFYLEQHKLIEKYHIADGVPREGGGGEYPLQDGFGWTNGVVRRLIGLYGEP